MSFFSAVISFGDVPENILCDDENWKMNSLKYSVVLMMESD